VNSGGWSWFPDWWYQHFQTLLEQLAEPTFDPWLLARYAVQALLVTLPIFLADFVCGLAILKAAGLRLAGGLKLAAALGLGTGAAALGIFLFGSLGRLTFKGLLVFTVLQGVVGLAVVWRDLRAPRLRWSWLWALPVLVVIVPDLMMPILEYDSTMYHMASAHWYMDQHKVPYHEGIRFNAQPHMPVMLYMRQWWLMSDANLVKLVNLEFLAMLGGLFAWLARRYRVKLGLVVAASLVFGSPIFGYIARQEYADLALTAWLSTGVCVLISRGARLQPNRLVVAGLLLGAAASSKLQGLLVASCFIAADLLVYLVRERKVGLSVRRALLVGLPLVGMGLPWWFRGWRYTGSPFYPFLSDSPDVKALFQVNAGYGVGRDLLSFVQMPWHMITIEPSVYADLFRFGPSCLILLVVAGLGFVLRWNRKMDASSAVAVLGSLLFTVLWFRSGQVMRYEACLLPVWALLLLSAIRRLEWRGPLVAVAMLPLLLASALLTNNAIRYGVPPPVTWPATQAVLQAVLPYYKATQAASRVVGRDELVYTWFCDDIRAYAPGKSYGDWFGGYTYTWLGNVHAGEKIRDAGTMVTRLKATGFKYIIVDRQRAARGGTIYGGEFLSSGLVKPFVKVPGTETIFDDGRYAVFRLT
jgi:hypothetical protein